LVLAVALLLGAHLADCSRLIAAPFRVFELAAFPDWQFGIFRASDYTSAFNDDWKVREITSGQLLPAAPDVLGPKFAPLWWHDSSLAGRVAEELVKQAPVPPGELKPEQHMGTIPVPGIPDPVRPEGFYRDQFGRIRQWGYLTPLVPFQHNEGRFFSPRVGVKVGLEGYGLARVGGGLDPAVPKCLPCRGNTPTVGLDLNGFIDFSTRQPITLEFVLARELFPPFPSVPPIPVIPNIPGPVDDNFLEDLSISNGLAPEPSTWLLGAIGVASAVLCQFRRYRAV
jgi:hypothetical protein